MVDPGRGGYDSGYAMCPCFWGTEPGSLVKAFAARLPSLAGLHVLDLGCGEGKNAAYLAQLGANVEAIDVSEFAISNALAAHSGVRNITWKVEDAVSFTPSRADFDAVVLYGILHCLKDHHEVEAVVARIKRYTKSGGYNVACAFNDRSQDLTAHPGFKPILLPHNHYLSLYQDWTILEASDQDLTESHPDNLRAHTHSMTRMLVRKP